MITRRVIVSGRVQGVWFRESTRREADAAGVRGWVRNVADGTVEAVFEGDPEAVARLIAWCQHGPPGASVAQVAVGDEPVEGLGRFEVRPTHDPDAHSHH